jgi:serine/threonine-protein kinase
MPPGEVVAIGQILAEGLDYIAGNHIVRLDLKPGNIIMADRGPVIMDLGVAFPADRSAGDFATGSQVIGTPAFMPPEVIEGHSPDPRAEVYGLGLVMYCLTGTTPWDGLPLGLLFAAILTEDIDMSALAISAEFRAVLRRAMARDPGGRFASATALRDALRDTPEWRRVAGLSPEAGPAADD